MRGGELVGAVNGDCGVRQAQAQAPLCLLDGMPYYEMPLQS